LYALPSKPGTYDALSHMLFDPPPTPGASGGPIIDERSGAVVGVVLGTMMDNKMQGLRGWGVPSETIFDVCLHPWNWFNLHKNLLVDVQLAWVDALTEN
jgi:hypothetical protein